jgi:GNAT superfamily N-acetyltransferase
LTTIDPGLDWEPARTIGSYLWYKAYVYLTPDTCFVLDDGTGRVVGYCIGTADTTAFAHRWRTVFAPVVDPVLVPSLDVQTNDPLMERDDVKSFRSAIYDANCSMLRAWPQMLQQYPAHMHMVILPEYQRRGYGTMLIEIFFQIVKSQGANGVHVDTVVHNVIGRLFYSKNGFQLCSQVLDGGASGYAGVTGIVLTLMRAI